MTHHKVLVEEQHRDLSVAYALKMAICVRKARDVPAGYFVLFWKWKPAAWPANEEWIMQEQVVSPVLPS